MENEMANQQWITKTVVGARLYGVRDAAKVLRLHAKDLRRDKQRDSARVVDKTAAALERVAQGATWAEAFELHDATPAA
jgi:hypothetical protein